MFFAVFESLPRVAFFAARDIDADEVLTVAMRRLYDAAHPLYAAPCRCGTPHCKLELQNV